MISAQRTLLLCTLAILAVGAVNGQTISCLVPDACNGPLVVLFRGNDACSPFAASQLVAWPILADAKPNSKGVCQNTGSSLAINRPMFQLAASKLGFSENVMEAMIGSLPRSLAGPTSSSLWDCSANNQTITVKAWSKGGCSGTPDAIDTAYPGVCLNGTDTYGKKVSWMSSCGWKAKILPPLVPVKTPLTSVPLIDRQSSRMCEGGGKCGFAYQTIYSDPNCGSALISLSWPQTTTTGQALQSGKCYGDVDPMGVNIGKTAYNIQYTCTSSTFTSTSYAAGCSGTPLNTLQIAVNKCFSNGSGTSMKVFCN